MHTSSTLLGRLSGPVTVLGGLLWAVGGATALNASALGIGMEGPHLVLSLAGLCSLVGLARLASHHAGHYGRAGMAGVFVASAGVVLIILSKNVPSGISEDVGWALFDVGGLLLVTGSLLLGIVAVRHKAGFVGGPLIAVGVLAILQLVFLMVPGAETGSLGTVVIPILIGLAWSVLGYVLWSDQREAVGRPPTSPTAPR
jgi:hypothetical protein